jgi:putative spermidine/putrescine transport system substrate-binding protein
VAVAASVAACGPTPVTTPSPSPAGLIATPPPASVSVAPDPLSDLVAAARSEGTLTTIGLSPGWCNYRATIDAFKQRYGLEVQELSPDATSSEQLDALRADPASGKAPDVVDVTMAVAGQAKAAKLLAPYKVSTWPTIPDAVKDKDGAWTGDYYGVLVFEVNTSVISSAPTAWADLANPATTGLLALAGDPRVSSQAGLAVLSASVANGGSLDDVKPGLTWLKGMAASNRLSQSVATSDTIDRGLTPLAMRWTYNALWHRDGTAGNPPIEVVAPTTGRIGVANAQAINARAPHPNAARLWLEFLYGDAGQNLWLDGYCHPARYADLAGRDAIPVETLARLPDTSGVVFPTVAQQSKALQTIADTWDTTVGLEIR